MPCGGIYPADLPVEATCFHCDKDGADMFCLEWDCFLHDDCVDPFLLTEEGKVVIAHGHEIIRMKDVQ